MVSARWRPADACARSGYSRSAKVGHDPAARPGRRARPHPERIANPQVGRPGVLPKPTSSIAAAMAGLRG